MLLRSLSIAGGLAIGLVCLPVQATSFTTSVTGGSGLQGDTASSTLKFDFTDPYDLEAANLEIDYNPSAFNPSPLSLDAANSTVQIGSTSYVLGNLQSGPNAYIITNNDVSGSFYALSFVPLNPAGPCATPGDYSTCTPTTLPFSAGDKVLMRLQFSIPSTAVPGDYSVAYSGYLNDDGYLQSATVRVEPSSQQIPLPATWLLLLPGLAVMHRLRSRQVI